MKKMLAMVLTAAMMLSLLTACGDQNTPSTPAETPEPSSEAPAAGNDETDAPAVDEVEHEEDTITVMFPPVTGNYEELVTGWIADFEKEYPWLHVELEMTSWDENPTKISELAAAGNAPDIVENDFKMIGTLVELGVAIDVAAYLDAGALADYDQNALDYLTLDGTLYGLPLYMTIQSLGGNKLMLENAGADVGKIQTQGWTWDEFEEILKKGTTADTFGLVFASAGTSTSDFVNIFGVAAGISNDFTPDLKYAYTSENMLNLLKTVETMVNAKYMPNYPVEAGKRLVMLQTGETMVTGKAMPLFESNVKKNIAAMNNGEEFVEGSIEDLEYVFLPVPTLDGVKPACYGIVDCLLPCRNKNTTDEHLKNVMLFLNYLTSGDRIAEVANQVYLPSVCESGRAAQTGSTLDQSDANAAASERCMGLVIAPPTGVTADQNATAKEIMNEVIVPKFQALIAGETTAQAMYDDICSEAFSRLGEENCETGFFTY